MQTLNLMPSALQRRRFLFDRLRVWGGCSLLVLGLLGASYAGMWRAVRVYGSQLGSREVLASRIADLKSEVAALKARRERLSARQAALGVLMQPSGWDEAVRVLAETAGDAVWLSDLSITQARGADGDAEGRQGARLRLSGFAVNHPEFAGFLARLNAHALISEADPADARLGMLRQGRLVQFTVTCRYTPRVSEGIHAAGPLHGDPRATRGSS